MDKHLEVPPRLRRPLRHFLPLRAQPNAAKLVEADLSLQIARTALTAAIAREGMNVQMICLRAAAFAALDTLISAVSKRRFSRARSRISSGVRHEELPAQSALCFLLDRFFEERRIRSLPSSYVTCGAKNHVKLRRSRRTSSAARSDVLGSGRRITPAWTYTAGRPRAVGEGQASATRNSES